MTVMALFDDADADAQDEEDKSIWMLKMSEVRMSITPKRAKRMKKAELEMFLVSSFPSSRVQYDGVFENRIRCAVVTQKMLTRPLDLQSHVTLDISNADVSDAETVKIDIDVHIDHVDNVEVDCLSGALLIFDTVCAIGAVTFVWMRMVAIAVAMAPLTERAACHPVINMCYYQGPLLQLVDANVICQEANQEGDKMPCWIGVQLTSDDMPLY